jgi:hypothetical protein
MLIFGLWRAFGAFLLMCFCSELHICIALSAILVIFPLTCYINENIYIFEYKWFGFVLMHMNIYVFFQNLNILCSFWSTSFFVLFFFRSSPVRFRIFGVDRFGPVFGSDNIGFDSHLLNSVHCFLQHVSIDSSIYYRTVLIRS